MLSEIFTVLLLRAKLWELTNKRHYNYNYWSFKWVGAFPQQLYSFLWRQHPQRRHKNMKRPEFPLWKRKDISCSSFHCWGKSVQVSTVQKKQFFICDRWCRTSSSRPADVWVWGRTRVCRPRPSFLGGSCPSGSSSSSSLPFSPSEEQTKKTLVPF